jgi:hypothetical protein
MDFLLQEARLGEPFIASPPLRKGGNKYLRRKQISKEGTNTKDGPNI